MAIIGNGNYKGFIIIGFSDLTLHLDGILFWLVLGTSSREIIRKDEVQSIFSPSIVSSGHIYQAHYKPTQA